MWDHCIYHSHIKCFLCVVISAKEENFTCLFLAYHFSKISGTIAAVKTSNVCVCLFKDGMFFTRQREIAYHVQTVSATHCPSGHYSNHYFWHKTDQALYFENI